MAKTHDNQSNRTGISFRAILLGLAGICLLCPIITWSQLVLKGIQVGVLQLNPTVMGLFLLLVLANRGVRRVRARFGLSSGELMIIYSMMLIAAMIASRGLMDKWISGISAVNYYASAENGWGQLFYPHIKSWLVPFNPEGGNQQPVIKAMYEGLGRTDQLSWANVFSRLPWGAWALPVATWSIFIFFIFGGFLCLAAILRKQWVENERMPFALAQLPLEMMQPETAGPFLRNRLTWLGFALPMAIFSLNGLHYIFPMLPKIQTVWNLNSYFPSGAPWDQVLYIRISLAFAVIGFSYLLPTDLLFSLWFFFLFTRFQDFVGSALGYQLSTMPLYPTHLFQGYQAMGAYAVLVFYLTRTSRPHFSAVIRKALFSDRSVNDKEEMLPYRVALFGLIFCCLGAIIWCWFAGLSLWLAALVILVYMFVIVIVMARSVAEGGILMTETTFRPTDIVALFGPRYLLGSAQLSFLSMLDAVILRDTRGLLLTGFMDGLRISDGVRLRRRSLLWTFVIAIPAAMLVAGFLHLMIPYGRGAINLHWMYSGSSIWGFSSNTPIILGQNDYTFVAPISFLVGIAFTIFLVAMRMRFSWWPFHPLGYAIAPSFTMIVFWFPCLIAWIVKVLILRWGGMKVYLNLRPFFLGLVLGEFSAAVLWTVITFIIKTHAPAIPWE